MVSIDADTDSAELGLELMRDLRYHCKQLNIDTTLLNGAEGELRAIKDFKVKQCEDVKSRDIDGHIGQESVQIKCLSSWTNRGGSNNTIEFRSPSFDWLILYSEGKGYKIPQRHLLYGDEGKAFMKPRGTKYRITCTQKFILSIQQYKKDDIYDG